MKSERRLPKGGVGREMACEEVRQQLADSMLGTLPEMEMAAVRRHLRGCGGCRADAARLDQGIALFATAAHIAEPPPELEDRVMSALAEEWSEAPAGIGSRSGPGRWLAVAAAVVAVAGALSWGAFSQVQTNRSRTDAASYRSFLGALGGREVRVASLQPASSSAFDGSAILYDSNHGQSWILVLARAPGYSGSVEVTVSTPGGSSIQLRPLQIDTDGEASSWLVTSIDISPYTKVTLRSPDGTLLASGLALSQD
jgi:anti-sigma-K factor RskA